MRKVFCFLLTCFVLNLSAQFTYDSGMEEVRKVANEAALGALTLGVNDEGYIVYQANTNEYHYWTGVSFEPLVIIRNYNSTVTYSEDEIVVYNGVFYVSKVNSNQGNQPDLSSVQWNPLQGENMATASLTSTGTRIHEVGAGGFSINNTTTPANNLILSHHGTTTNGSLVFQDGVVALSDGTTLIRLDSDIMLQSDGEFILGNGAGGFMPTIDSDDYGNYVAVEDLTSNVVYLVHPDAFRVTPVDGAPVDGTNVSYYVGEVFWDRTGKNFYESLTASSDPDVAATGSTFSKIDFLSGNDNSGSGYIDIGNVRIQWGTDTYDSNGEAYIEYVVPFGTVDYSFVATVLDDAYYPVILSRTSAEIELEFKGAGGLNATVPSDYNWIAIGLKP